GVDEAKVDLVQERYERLSWPERRSIPAEPADPHAVLEAVLYALGTTPADGDDEASVDPVALAEAVEALTGDRIDFAGDEVGVTLFEHLSTMEPVRLLMEELEHPRSLEDVTNTLRARLGRTSQPPDTSTAEVLAYLALGAFAQRGETPLLRPKLHVFVRGL